MPCRHSPSVQAHARSRGAIPQQLLGAATLGLASALSVPAAEAQAPDAATLPPISVTGAPESGYRRPETSLTRLPGRLQDVPQTVNVVTEELMREQGATRLRDALRNVPGITLNAGEGGAQGDVLTLRGFPARGDLYLDGLRDVGSYTRDSFNLEAVEVLKGPSSTLFGRGSTGGAVNQVSKTPTLAPLNEASLEAGSNLLARATADINQPIGERAALRVNLMGERSDVADRDEIEQKRWGVAPSIAFGIGGPTELTLSYLHQEEDNVPDFGLPFLNGRPAPVSRDTFYGLADTDREQVRVDVATLRVRHEINESLSLSNALRYGHYDRELDPTAPRIAAAPPGTPLEDLKVNRSRPARDGVETVLVNQTDLTARFATGPVEHELITGLELGRETSRQERFTAANVPQADLLDPDPDADGSFITRQLSSNTRTTAYTVGLYALDRIRLSEQWEIVGGLRWDRFDARYEDRVSDTRFDRVDEMVSTRASLVWRPTEEQTYYLSYGTSFNPSAENLSLSAGNADLEPEKNRIYEAGAKLDLLDGRLGLRGALFRIEKTNARTPDPANAAVSVLEGKQRVDGFEAEIVGRLTDRWDLLLGYTYLDSEIVESNNPAEVGNRLQNTPKHSVAAWTSYDLGEGWQIGTGLFYVGERYANNSNSNEVPGYLRWDAMIGYRTGPLDLRLNAYNLTDKDYFESVYPGHAVPGPGRTVTLTATTRF